MFPDDFPDGKTVIMQITGMGEHINEEKGTHTPIYYVIYDKADRKSSIYSFRMKAKTKTLALMDCEVVCTVKKSKFWVEKLTKLERVN